MYGQLGILDYDPVEDKVECHICGKWFRGLNNHVLRTHGFTVDEYREEFGLNRGQGLICEGTRQQLAEINKRLGLWKYLPSQTMTKEEIGKFLRQFTIRGYKLRQQTIIPRSQRLRLYNPMNEPEVKQRRIATQRKTWYGSQRMRELCRQNMLKVIDNLRHKNLEERRWTCPCGEAFPVRKAGEHHRKQCPIARQIKRGRVIKAREQYLKELTPERRQEINQHISQGKKKQYATVRS